MSMVLKAPLKFYGKTEERILANETIVYEGPPCDAIIDIRGGSELLVENVKFYNKSEGVDSLIRVSNLPHSPSSGRGATKVDLVNVTQLMCVPTKYGIAIGANTPNEQDSDRNNDFGKIENAFIPDAYDSSIFVSGTQVHGLRILDCGLVNYNGKAKHGIKFDYGLSATIRGCSFNAFNDSDIYFAGNAMKLLVDDCISEHSRFMLRTGNSGSFFNVVYRNCRLQYDCDDYCIHYRHGGPLKIEDCIIELMPMARQFLIADHPRMKAIFNEVQFYVFGENDPKMLLTNKIVHDRRQFTSRNSTVTFITQPDIKRYLYDVHPNLERGLVNHDDSNA